MYTIKILLRFTAALAVFACISATLVETKNPDTALKAINGYRLKAFRDAQSSGKQIDLMAINAEVTKMATDAIDGVEVDKVEPSTAYSWARLFSMAGRHKEACDLCAKYVATNPDAQEKFDAQILMLTSCNNLGEGKMLAATLPEITAPSVEASQSLLQGVVGTYADTIYKDMGLDAALKAIDKVMGQVKFEKPEDYAARMLPNFKKQNLRTADGSPLTDEQVKAFLVAQGRSLESSLEYQVADEKASLYKKAGKEDQGLAVLKKFVADHDAKDPYVPLANKKIAQVEMIGAPSVPLKYDRKYGDFNGLDQWLGKVVIIEFTAHW